jgi:DNA polymerase III subunit epsilon
MNKQLNQLQYLIFDIQASNPKPEKGSILEMGWSVFNFNKSQERSVNCSEVIQPKKGMKIPKHNLRVTGLTEEMLQEGKKLEEVCLDLLAQVKNIQTMNKNEFCPTIIHFAQYEIPFLKYLIDSFTSLETSPFSILCTHKISKRLWPDLPRKGLRAIAGFLGWTVETSRRSVFHLDATAWIWRYCLEYFQTQKIQTWAELDQWFNMPVKKTSTTRSYPMNPEKRKNLPQEPGVYHMFRPNGDLLYVGKATSLKQRINSYFRKSSKHAEHILEMLSQAVDLTITQTHSALEAALLETDDIKNLNPPYNRALMLKERQLKFLSEKFEPVDCSSLDQKVLGPIPTTEPFLLINFVTQILNQVNELVIEDLIGTILFGNKKEDLPELEIFNEGLNLFKTNFKFLTENQISVKNLIRFGGLLRRIKIEEALEEHEASIEEIEIITEDEGDWSPVMVCKRIEGLTRFTHKLLSRSNWYARLANATISWEKRQSGKTNVIAFQHGVILKNYQISGVQDLINQEYFKINLQWVKRNFDIFDYDRMRVLTTEIKRLVKENRNPLVQLNSTCRFDAKRLVLILPWV